MPTPSDALPVEAAIESPVEFVHPTCPEAERITSRRPSEQHSHTDIHDDASSRGDAVIDPKTQDEDEGAIVTEGLSPLSTEGRAWVASRRETLPHSVTSNQTSRDGSNRENNNSQPGPSGSSRTFEPATSHNDTPSTIMAERTMPATTESQPATPVASTPAAVSVGSPSAVISEQVNYRPDQTSGWEFSTQRLYDNHTSSFLHAGSKFSGTQQSDRQRYNVDVEIKHVDMAESFLCGYLRIQGLTEDHPTLTTYFEGEIIGSKHTFQTRHETWGATAQTDMQHWNRFPAWRPLAAQAKKSDFHYKNFAGRENLFMRWKEYFLVPDHRVRTINGASFEGFYYICFNQVAGSVSGIYFHARSEKYQQLELKHVPDNGCVAAMEFR